MMKLLLAKVVRLLNEGFLEPQPRPSLEALDVPKVKIWLAYGLIDSTRVDFDRYNGG